MRTGLPKTSAGRAAVDEYARDAGARAALAGVALRASARDKLKRSIILISLHT